MYNCSDLPSEILTQIFSFVDVSERLPFSEVSTSWASVMEDIWKETYAANWKIKGKEFKKGKSWKKIYYEHQTVDKRLNSQGFSFHFIEGNKAAREVVKDLFITNQEILLTYQTASEKAKDNSFLGNFIRTKAEDPILDWSSSHLINYSAQEKKMYATDRLSGKKICFSLPESYSFDPHFNIKLKNDQIFALVSRGFSSQSILERQKEHRICVWNIDEPTLFKILPGSQHIYNRQNNESISEWINKGLFKLQDLQQASNYLAIREEDRTLCIWRLNESLLENPLKITHSSKILAYKLFEKRLLILDDSHFYILKNKTGEQIACLPRLFRNSEEGFVRFSESHILEYTSSSKTIRITQAYDGNILADFSLPQSFPQDILVTSLEYAFDKVFIGTGKNAEIYVWDLTQNKLQAILKELGENKAQEVACLKYADGNLIAASKTGKIIRWHLGSFEKKTCFSIQNMIETVEKTGIYFKESLFSELKRITGN